ncbi:hypothetical protein GDO81_012607 [Engystomops pustulosus]|uniref:Fanconi anemia core complex-associated protein 100 n=1 Tax=Engystomops pustulosus TaxID=76066 RepID=A0AAV7AUE3_ENGPU|nr:hypothetical protein GDO81_012607 [Engystomops pustulosus]
MYQIENLVTLQSPNGGLSKCKARIVHWNTDLYICNGTRSVFVFSLEKKQIKAVYLFPSNVCHIEICTGLRQLYALCAHNGLYLLEWDEHGRLLMEPSPAMIGGDMTIYQVGSNFALLLDPTLCSFTVARQVLVIVLSQQDKWKITVLHRASINHEDLISAPSREVKFSSRSGMNRGDLQPVLCTISLWKEEPMNTVAPCDIALDPALFTRLFGVDVAILESPIILCGFPDGQVISFPLKSAGVQQSCNQSSTQGSSELLYHLEQPVVSIGAIRMVPGDHNTEQPSTGNKACDCLLIVGQQGLVVSVTGGDKPGSVYCEYKDYRLPASVSCTLYSMSGVYCCTASDLIYVTIPQREREATSKTKSSTMASLRHNIPMIAALSSSDDEHLVALSRKGRLMLCKLNHKGSKDQRHGQSCVNTGQRMKELLSGIGSVSERFTLLKSAADEKSKSLARLNQVLSLSQRSICSVVLHWLLSEVLAKEPDVQEVQGLTPDGKEFVIRVQEVSVSDLSSERSIQAVEVQILSSHIHVVASLHLAVISRLKVLLHQDTSINGGLCPDLDLGKIQQLFSAHEPFLKEVKNLRERLGVDEDIISSAAAKRLLHIYRALRDPGLLFI